MSKETKQTITVRELQAIMPSLNQLASAKNLDFNQSIRISKIVKKIKHIMKHFEEQKKPLFDKYGETMGNGAKQIKPEHIEEFNKQLEPLLDAEVDFNITKVKLDGLVSVRS